jgi:Tfp pilus assembly protein PilF
MKKLQLNPRSDDAYVDLGMIHSRMGKKQEANAAFRKAVNINPNMKNVINQLTKQKPA